MASDVLFIIVSLADGIGLSILYFGGLWLTVQVLPASSRPAFLMVGSFLVRIAATLVGLYCILGDGRWESLVAFMLGFLCMRGILIRQLQSRHMNISLLLRKNSYGNKS